MTTLKILQYPDSRLKTKTTEVKDAHHPRIQQVIEDMLETLGNTENCAGLSANQLEMENPPKITVINSPEGGEPLCLLNPEVVEARGQKREVEGCMSVYPDNNISASVDRATWVKVKAQDRNGNPITIEAEGFLAKCLQHEIDHLNGIVYIDKVSALKRRMIEKKINKLRTRG